ncbi:DUF1456 domain-containing protein, partial [Proteus mirabilis]
LVRYFLKGLTETLRGKGKAVKK